MPNRWHGGWLSTHAVAPPNRSSTLWGVIGYQRQIDQKRLKIDAQPDLQSLISATMTIRLSLTASSPHSNAGHAGGNPID